MNWVSAPSTFKRTWQCGCAWRTNDQSISSSATLPKAPCAIRNAVDMSVSPSRPVLSGFPQLLLMRLGQFSHAGEPEGDMRQFAGIHGSAKTLLGISPVDPAGFQPDIVGRLVIMEHAFGGVKDLLLPDADLAEPLDHVFEIADRRLVRPDVFRGVHGVELDLQPAIARLEGLVVDVGKDGELEMFLQVLQRAGSILECWPVSDRAAVFDAVLVRRMDAPLFGKTLVDDREQVPISHCRRIALLAGLVTGVRLKYLVTRERPPGPAAEALQGLDHPALPIDQRAVTVEGERVEIREQHVGS